MQNGLNGFKPSYCMLGGVGWGGAGLLSQKLSIQSLKHDFLCKCSSLSAVEEEEAEEQSCWQGKEERISIGLHDHCQFMVDFHWRSCSWRLEHKVCRCLELCIEAGSGLWVCSEFVNYKLHLLRYLYLSNFFGENVTLLNTFMTSYFFNYLTSFTPLQLTLLIYLRLKNYFNLL